MCAVIGAVIEKPRAEDYLMLHRVFLESKIRGMHATGVAYVKHNQVHIDKRPVSANNFPFNFPEYVNEDGNLYLLGHCRYSTSDLEYNQPIGDASDAIVHNGVITQELPENWEKLYGYKTMTKNDSELVLHSEDPLVEFSHMSMGVCKLTADKKLIAYRNGKRPLYLTNLENGCIITSTADIAKRAEVYGISIEVPMNTYLTFDESFAMMVDKKDITNSVDYQHYELC